MASSKFDEAAEVYVKKWKGRKIAIYPFGAMGMETKRVLNWKYGIEEALIVDNRLAEFNPQITTLNEVMEPQEYIWIVACSAPQYHKQVLMAVRELVPEEQIIDVFYDLPIYPDEEYRVLSGLGTKEAEYVSTPCREFVDIVRKKKNENRIITVAEVGVGHGASSVKVCELLSKEDTYYGFDYEDSLENLFYDLDRIPEICCKRIKKGNSHKLCDSYNWNLSEMLFEMRNSGKNGIFDVVYLDGAHTFLHDGLACCLLKELLKPGGYIIFDDIFLTFKTGGYQKLYLESKEIYPEEQLCECQVQRVVNALMIEDKGFQQIYMTPTLNPSRAVFMKK